VTAEIPATLLADQAAELLEADMPTARVMVGRMGRSARQARWHASTAAGGRVPVPELGVMFAAWLPWQMAATGP
jgi:hypothetical protein